MSRFIGRSKKNPNAKHSGRVTHCPKPTPEIQPKTDIEPVEEQQEIEVFNEATVTSMDSSLLPGVFDCKAVILRNEFEAYCPGYSYFLDSLADKSQPDLEGRIVEAFTAHISHQARELKRLQVQEINASFGRGGLVRAMSWAEKVDIPTPNVFLHTLNSNVPEVIALGELIALVDAYRARALEIVEEKSGLNYDEASVAKILVRYIEDQRTIKAAELEEAFSGVLPNIEVQESTDDNGDIRILWTAKNPQGLVIALQKIKRLLRKLNNDFEGWYLEGLSSFLARNFFYTEDQNMAFMSEHVAPLFNLLAGDIKQLANDLNDQYKSNNVIKENPQVGVDEAAETAPESSVNSAEEVLHITHAATYEVIQDYPWLSQTQVDEPRQLLCYEVNGHGKVYVATALSDKLVEISKKAAGTLLDNDVFEDLRNKAIKGIASRKAYKVEKATSKGMAKSNPTPYDNFTIHKEAGGKGGNSSRMYFVHTRVSRVVEELPSGVDPEGHLIVVIAETDKDNQDIVLELINGSPRRTAKRRGAGN